MGLKRGLDEELLLPMARHCPAVDRFDLEVALLRLPRGPKTARHVGKLRKNRDKIAAILQELLSLINRETC